MGIKKDRCNGTDWKAVVSIAVASIVAVIIVAFVIFLVIFSFYIGFNENKNDVFVGLCTLFTGILAITGVCFTIYFNQKIKDKELYEAQKLKNQELLNDLDQKSEWRKELMNIAAKPVMQLEDVFRILASLRFLPKSEDEVKQSEQKDFDEISNYIYEKLIEKISDFYFNNKININKTIEKETLEKEISCYSFNILDSEEIRQYVKFLLKHHWEYNQSEKDKEDFIKKERKEFFKVIDQVDEITEDEKFENLFTSGYETLSDKVKGYKTFEISVKKIDENTAKYISGCKSNNKIIVKNLTLDKKGCKTILKGQYKGNK
ncbi:hypothetical protein BUZ55_10160 [Staphylococcus hominis]|uniref:hypothetical protein n=1 Tax=Staphylococcus hominis TaxID=1290 RepID=UPI000E67FED9|nr:hypothetical protein [Staphylococcus hominis]RIO48198.1 hypothetical protein BUZ55_10160 [Staphylococcus hominis]